MKKILMLLMSLVLLTGLFSGCSKSDTAKRTDELIKNASNATNIEDTTTVTDNGTADAPTDPEEGTSVSTEDLDFTKALPNYYRIEMITYNHVVKEEFDGDVFLKMDIQLTQNIGEDEIVTFIPVGVPDDKELPLLHDSLTLVPGYADDNKYYYETILDVDAYKKVEGIKPKYPFYMVTIKPLFDDVKVIPYSSDVKPYLWKNRNSEELVAIISLDGEDLKPNILVYERFGDTYIEREYAFYDKDVKEWYTFKVERINF